MELVAFLGAAREHEIVFEDGNRGSNEERAHMKGEPAVKAAIYEHVVCVLVDPLFIEVVVEVFDVFVIRYVVADCSITRLGYIFL